MIEHNNEVLEGRRFEFGANWARFLDLLNANRIMLAEQSLREKLGSDDLYGKTFLDIGSGSGLFSLAARRLGMSVHSFDYDPQSVACTAELKRRYFPDDMDWHVEQGSVLDADYLMKLGQYDIVYSWGVLHHTGDQWQALANVNSLVRDGGKLFIALYNDQGIKSKRWKYLKKLYCGSPVYVRHFIVAIALLIAWGPTMLSDIFRGRAFQSWRSYGKSSDRGMSPWYDLIDWIGGYPFEVSKPEEVFYFFRSRGFYLEKLQTCGGGLGCNEFVFSKS